MSYTYLLVNLGLLLIPVLLFTIKPLQFTVNSKFIILAPLICLFTFSVPTEFLTRMKVFVFNPPYLTGITLWELPVEELLMLFVMPLCGLAVYLFINYRYPKNNLEKYSLAISNMLLGICIAMLYFGHKKEFTLLTFAILLVFVIYIEYVNKIRFMYKFYRAFVVTLLPFYVVYGILTVLPVIQYTDTETLNFNVFHIPFESHFYLMSMLLLTIYVYELFKSKVLR